MKFSSDIKEAISQQLAACLAVQRTYGKQASDLAVVLKIFLSDLEDYEGSKITMAIKDWRKQSPEFPTPSDIIKILKSYPADKSVVDKTKYASITTRKAAGQYINPQEEEFMRAYEMQLLR